MVNAEFMNTVSPKLAVGCALLLSLLTQPAGGAARDAMRAGVAEIDINPPVGHRMAGYFNERFATGTHDLLKAKAIVLAQGKEKFALVFCDLIGTTLHVSTNARARISAQTGIPVSHILIAATHTHTGPLFDDVRRDFLHEEAVARLGKDPQEEIYYPDFLVERPVKVATEAHAKLAPANVFAGIAKREGLAFNRRYHMRDGRVVFNPGVLNTNIVKLAGPVDPSVGILCVRDATSDRPLGSLTVFACHCDTVGGTEYGADYPHFIEQTLRSKLGADFCSAFAAGTCGDINHINVSVKGSLPRYGITERIGVALGQTVLDNLAKLDRVTKPRLAVRSVTLTVPLQEVTSEQVKTARENMPILSVGGGTFTERVEATKVLDLAARGKIWPMEVQVFRLDKDTALVGLPGEIFCDLGLAIKSASPFKKTIVMSLCNDRLGYVPTKKASTEGSYEVTNARVKPGGGEMLVEAAVKFLKQLH